MEIHRYKLNDNDPKIYWRIIDKASQTGVYVNGVIIPKKEFIPLNDNDLISIGGNYTIESARRTNSEKKDNKRAYLYRIKAPKCWDSDYEDSDEDQVTQAYPGTPPTPPPGNESDGEESEDFLNDEDEPIFKKPKIPLSKPVKKHSQAKQDKHDTKKYSQTKKVKNDIK